MKNKRGIAIKILPINVFPKILTFHSSLYENNQLMWDLARRMEFFLISVQRITSSNWCVLMTKGEFVHSHLCALVLYKLPKPVYNPGKVGKT